MTVVWFKPLTDDEKGDIKEKPGTDPELLTKLQQHSVVLFVSTPKISFVVPAGRICESGCGVIFITTAAVGIQQQKMGKICIKGSTLICIIAFESTTS